MAVLTTNTITRNPTGVLGPISQAVIKIVNSGTAKAVVYITGLNNDVSPATLFAQELFEVNYREVVSKTYNITENFFNLMYLILRKSWVFRFFLWTVEESGFRSA